jgi:hypothetical protein
MRMVILAMLAFSAQKAVRSVIKMTLVSVRNVVMGTITKLAQGNVNLVLMGVKHAPLKLYVPPAPVGIGRSASNVCKLVNSLVLGAKRITQLPVLTAMEGMLWMRKPAPARRICPVMMMMRWPVRPAPEHIPSSGSDVRLVMLVTNV